MMQRHRLVGGFSLGLLCGIAGACNDGGDADAGAGACEPGEQLACACPGGEDGLRQCSPDGVLGPCACGETSEGDTEPSSTSNDASSGEPTCGNGVEDPGECPAACPHDCGSADDTTDGGAVSCAIKPYFVTSVPPQPSVWASGGLLGFAAGEELCREAALAVGAVDPMAVSVCDYEQVLLAEAAGELAVLPAGTSAWVHRTTVADVQGVSSAPGPGGRCANWAYRTNHIADGEHMLVGANGAVSYFLDNDTFYDGVDGSHAQPGMLECGTEERAILCCNPPCMPES